MANFAIRPGKSCGVGKLGSRSLIGVNYTTWPATLASPDQYIITLFMSGVYIYAEPGKFNMLQFQSGFYTGWPRENKMMFFRKKGNKMVKMPNLILRK
jgi:hypothetical protein